MSIAKLSVYMHFSTICVQRKILKHHKTPTRIPFALLVKCRNFTIIKSIIKKKLDSLVTKKTSSVLNELKIIFEGTKGQRSLEPVDIFNRCRETNPHGPLLCIKYIQTILTREFIIWGNTVVTHRTLSPPPRGLFFVPWRHHRQTRLHSSKF